MEYSDKVILITGASSGIGRAVARALSHHDNRIVITARRAALLHSLQQEIEANGSRCLALPGDATQPEHGEEVVEEIVRAFQRIDIAILNVGAGPPSNSLATYFGIPMQGDYTAAKAAGRIFLETARIELEHFGLDHIEIQTIHPGFVDTEAVREDGIPAPNEISEDEAAAFVLKGIHKEVRENRFPRGTGLAVRAGRLAPYWIRSKILRSEAPADY
jgi:NAD(P)-dependent dehydrogenase (short-subunit alcohol dehydrogenase family)